MGQQKRRLYSKNSDSWVLPKYRRQCAPLLAGVLLATQLCCGSDVPFAASGKPDFSVADASLGEGIQLDRGCCDGGGEGHNSDAQASDKMSGGADVGAIADGGAVEMRSRDVHPDTLDSEDAALFDGAEPDAVVEDVAVVEDARGDVIVAIDTGLVDEDGGAASCPPLPPCAVCCDADRDGFFGREGCGWQRDCNDLDPLINPAAFDLPDDGVDQDCQGGDRILSEANALFVANTGSDLDGDGSRALPFATIGRALVVAEHMPAAEDLAVVVAAGVYNESISTGISLFGGFDPVSWEQDTGLYPTRLYGGGGVTLSVITGGRVALSGMEVYGGSGPQATAIDVAEWGSLFVHDCTVDAVGGGDWARAIDNSGVLQVVASQLYGGTGYSAVALNNRSDGLAQLAWNYLHGGHGEGYTFAVYNLGDLVAASNVIIGGNAGEGRGYGIYSNAGAIALLNNTIAAGSGDSLSSAISLSGGLLQLVNNVLLPKPGDNSVVVHIWEQNNPLVELRHNNFVPLTQTVPLIAVGARAEQWVESIAQLEQCGDWGWCLGAEGNISVDPVLQVDLSLGQASPCINAGMAPWDYPGAMLAGWDYWGEQRPQGACWDMGAAEFME